MSETKTTTAVAGSQHATGSAKFVPEGAGHIVRYAEGSVAVYRGTTDAGIKCLAVEMKHHASGNAQTFILSLNGASALVMLLSDALSPNAPASATEAGQ